MPPLADPHTLPGFLTMCAAWFAVCALVPMLAWRLADGKPRVHKIPQLF